MFSKYTVRSSRIAGKGQVEHRRGEMKKIEIIIRPGKLDDLRELLEVCEYHGIMITNIMEIGRAHV